jgi:hypothetical protein
MAPSPADREPTEAERRIAYRNAPGWAMEAGWEPPPGWEYTRQRMAGAPSMPEEPPEADWPDVCGNCGAPRRFLYWDPADGFGCNRCYATDADETG